MKEITFELTDYCPNSCPYCSSNAGPSNDKKLSLEKIKKMLEGKEFDRINISGGEPLAHPDIYVILRLCKCHIRRGGLVALYTNAIDMIVYNAGVIEGVRVEANLTVLDYVKSLHVLKRVRQGIEATRPDIHFSKNWDGKCNADCGHVVVRPDGTISKAPCRKYEEVP